MGVLNCTPDSFSDGNNDNLKALILRAKQMVLHGANVVDVGGESTRPNASPVDVQEELARVIPVVQALTERDIPVSIDTMKAEVMQKAIVAGARLVNDVSALTFDSNSLYVVADTGVDVCLMHMQGNVKTMQTNPHYDDVLSEVLFFFEQRIEACVQAGVQTSAMILDPGIGFGKRLEDNLNLIANINVIKKTFDMPVLLGASRKSFLGAMTNSEVHQREIETAVASTVGIFCGADMIRVHDCFEHHKTALVASKLADAKIL
ncbi:MAG: dihydropteroate synthase [Ghiorsea sp.]|nr:dihydropteroate synthase [Ghiorsea sp.]